MTTITMTKKDQKVRTARTKQKKRETRVKKEESGRRRRRKRRGTKPPPALVCRGGRARARGAAQQGPWGKGVERIKTFPFPSDPYVNCIISLAQTPKKLLMTKRKRCSVSIAFFCLFSLLPFYPSFFFWCFLISFLFWLFYFFLILFLPFFRFCFLSWIFYFDYFISRLCLCCSIFLFWHEWRLGRWLFALLFPF